MFEKKDIPYDLGDSHILHQSVLKKITWKNTFIYYGSHIWNLLSNDLKKHKYKLI